MSPGAGGGLPPAAGVGSTLCLADFGVITGNALDLRDDIKKDT
jgi:hypothetical protein